MEDNIAGFSLRDDDDEAWPMAPEVMVEFTQQHSSTMVGLDGKKRARFSSTVSVVATDLDSTQTPSTFDAASSAYVTSLSGIVSRQLDTMFRFESLWVFKPSCEYEIRRASICSIDYGSVETRHQADPFDDILAKITEVKLTLNMEADREDLFWGQKAWVNWLRYGDRSTSFYLKFATFRKPLNSVSSLVDDDGRTCPDIDAMFRVATRYF
ncbi:hypothetical protein GOBAR_DD01194 [Gossypium barbadense]|nr:hypothetical protein GOBAR_DD01194 [Gossypium barbadense]